MSGPFQISYAPQAADDIRALRSFDRGAVVGGIEQYLTHEPSRVSKSRIKPMVQPFWSQYRLRLDRFRVYYDLDDTHQRVSVLRVLEKGTGTTPQESP